MDGEGSWTFARGWLRLKAKTKSVGEVGDEAALLRALAHPGPDGGRGGVQVHAVAAQILAATLDSISHLGVARDRGSDGLGG
jgi:hypothetical protein